MSLLLGLLWRLPSLLAFPIYVFVVFEVGSVLIYAPFCPLSSVFFGVGLVQVATSGVTGSLVQRFRPLLVAVPGVGVFGDVTASAGRRFLLHAGRLLVGVGVVTPFLLCRVEVTGMAGNRWCGSALV